MYDYRSLSFVSYEEIYETFKNAFSDYVVPFSKSFDELIYMIERRGFNADISFGAFYNNELVGFTLNGIGSWEGKLTAYDTGTGVLKEHRKKGIAKQIFLESLPVLRNNNIEQYLLEVIDSNKPAVDLYKKMGFQETRRLNFQVIDKNNLSLKQCDSSVKIMEVENISWNEAKVFWNDKPSWQNSIESIERKRDSFSFVTAKKSGNIIGYGIIQKSNGDIPQLAVKRENRKTNIASALLNYMKDLTDSENFRFINTIQNDDETNRFFEKIGVQKEGSQLEMIKILD